MKPTATNWPEIRQYYETTGESLRATATKFQVSERTLFRRSSKECWRGGGGNGRVSGCAPSEIGSNGGGSGSENGGNQGAGLAFAAKNGSGDGSDITESGSTGGSSAPESGSASSENGSSNGSSMDRRNLQPVIQSAAL